MYFSRNCWVREVNRRHGCDREVDGVLVGYNKELFGTVLERLRK